MDDRIDDDTAFAALPGASDRLATALTRLARPVTLARGDTLFRQGDPGAALYTLEKGLLEVSVVSPEGQKLTLNALLPGDTFGEIALFDAGPRTATVTALEDSRLSQVERRVLTEALRREPDLAIDALDLAGRRLRWYGEAVRELAFLPVAARLARRLLYLQGRFGQEQRDIRLTQTELSEHVGATREAVSKVLAGWRRAGLIELGRGRLRVTQPEALALVAAGTED